MTRIIRSAVCAALFATSAATSFATPAFAAETAKAPTRAESCAERYLKALDMEKTMVAMMNSAMPAMLASMPEADQVDPVRKQQILDAINEGMLDVLPSMMADMTPLLTTSFTEAELCATADFYETPEGSSMLAKMPAYMQNSQALMTKYMPLMRDAMARRVCAKIGCEAESDPKKTRSNS